MFVNEIGSLGGKDQDDENEQGGAEELDQTGLEHSLLRLNSHSSSFS